VCRQRIDRQAVLRSYPCELLLQCIRNFGAASQSDVKFIQRACHSIRTPNFHHRSTWRGIGCHSRQLFCNLMHLCRRQTLRALPLAAERAETQRHQEHQKQSSGCASKM
jgi:hypothetical protein